MNIRILFLGMLISFSNIFSQDIYEPDNSSETAIVVSSGDTLARSFHVDGDDDWFRFELTHPLSKVVFGPANYQSGNWLPYTSRAMRMVLYNENLVETASVAAGDNDDIRISEILTPGTYYVKVDDWRDKTYDYEWNFDSRPTALWEITTVIEGAGSASPSDGNLLVEEGYEQSVQFYPDDYNKLDSVYVNGLCIGRPGRINFPETTVRDQNIRVVFAPSPDRLESGNLDPVPIQPGVYRDLSMIYPDNQDWFSFTLSSSQRVHLQADNTRNNREFDMALFSSDGSEIAYHDDTAHASIDIQLEAGDYTFALRKSSNIHSYDLIFHVRPADVDSHTISAAGSPGGRVDPQGTLSVPDLGNAAIAVIPDTGYVVDYVVLDNDTLYDDRSTWEFNQIYRNHDLYVQFRKQETFTVTITSIGEGTVSPAGQHSVTEGDDFLVKFEPDSNEHIGYILVVGDSVGIYRDSILLTNIREDLIIHIAFSENGSSVFDPPRGVNAHSKQKHLALYGNNIHYKGTAPIVVDVYSLKGELVTRMRLHKPGIYPLHVARQVFLLNIHGSFDKNVHVQRENGL